MHRGSSVRVLCVLCVLALGVTEAVGDMVVWTAPAMTRVQPEDAATGESRIAISAARSEWEPFQVIVTARGEPLRGVTVEASHLMGPRSAIASAHRYSPRKCPKAGTG